MASTPKETSTSAGRKVNAHKFEFHQSNNTFTPYDLIELPRPGNGVANPGPNPDLVFIPVSRYSKEDKKTRKTIYLAPLNPSDEHVHLPVLTGGSAFWLDSRTLGHVVGDDLYAVSVEYHTQPGRISTKVSTSPYLVGSFPEGTSPSNFKFTGAKTVETSSAPPPQPLLVFSAYVYTDDYDLHSIAERDKERAKRDTDALVFDELFVRHWDEYRGEKQPSLFTVSLKKEGEKWVLGKDFIAPLKGTGHYTPVEPFGGTDDFDVSSTFIAYTTKNTRLNVAAHTRQEVYVVPLTGGIEPKQLTLGDQGATHSIVFSNSGHKVAWTEMDLDGYESDRAKLVIYDLQKEVKFTVTKDWDRGIQEVAFSDDDSLVYVTASEAGHVKVFALEVPSTPASNEGLKKSPSVHTLTEEHSTHGLQPLPGNRLLFTQASFTSPNNVYVASVSPNSGGLVKDSIKKITVFADHELKGKYLDKGQSYWFEGAEGRQVHGWFLKPDGYDDKKNADKKWPAVFFIHGGPQGAWEDGWSTRWNPNVWAQQGYVVIAVNPTGSTGFGQDFVDGITKDWGGKPFVDLQKGWKFALDNFKIDSERTVAAGASWGGYAINWIQGHPEYGFGFKALICHDGIFDTRAGGFATDELYFWEHDFGGKPWDEETRRLADRFNPSAFVHKWSTPQLIFHGGKDYRLADTEGLSAFNALQRRRVPSRLVLFPSENHWVLNPANSLKWHYEVFRWIDEWIGEEK